jgi:hypothetical protein
MFDSPFNFPPYDMNSGPCSCGAQYSCLSPPCPPGPPDDDDDDDGQFPPPNPEHRTPLWIEPPPDGAPF